MAGFQPRSSGYGSDRSANCATTTARLVLFSFLFFPLERIQMSLPVTNSLRNLGGFLTWKNSFKRFSSLSYKMSPMGEVTSADVIYL